MTATDGRMSCRRLVELWIAVVIVALDQTRDWHFWAFNVADGAITVGVSLMILDLLGLGHRVSRAV